MMNNKFSYYRDNFNLRFNQYLLLAGVMITVIYIIIGLLMIETSKSYLKLPVKFFGSLLVFAGGYMVIFFIQVPLYKRLTKKYVNGLTKIEVTIDQLQETFVKERANTVAMINFYVPEYVVSFYNQEYNCYFELVCIRKLPAYSDKFLGDWEGEKIIIDADLSLIERSRGKKTPVKVFNFQGMGYNLDKYFFQSASEHASTIPRNLIYYIIFPVLTLGISLLGLYVFVML